MRYQYKILNEMNEILHDSINGIAGKSGFNDPIKATIDGDLINDMKYPDMPTYVLVYEWNNSPETNN